MDKLEKSSHNLIFYIQHNVPIIQLGKAAISLLAMYYMSNKIKCALFDPLNNIPGPFYRRFFPHFGNIGLKSGERFRLTEYYHRKYGHVVRVGPDALSVSDKDIIKQILVIDDFEKGPAYSRLQNGGEASMLDLISKDLHRRRRRAISPAFSTKYIKSLEPFFASSVESLIKKIDSEIEKTKGNEEFGTIDIWHITKCMALDVIGETAFGGTFNMIDNDDHIVPSTILKLMKILEFVISYPWVTKIPFLKRNKRIPQLSNFVKNLIKSRLESNVKRDDILQILVDTMEAEDKRDRLTEYEIITETILFLVAGSETTSNTIGFALIEMCRNPDSLEKLFIEIDGVDLDGGSNVFNQNQLKNLPYLNAIIKETMRLNTMPANGLERMVTRDIILKGDIFVPKGTKVRCNISVAQVHPEYWSNPSAFKPERWLEDSNEKASPSAYFPFSAGSRNCIGKDFALNEMRLVLATLIKHYYIEPIPEQMVAAMEKRHYLTLTIASSSFKIRMKRRFS
ncbi:cytochrome P450 CYP5313 [Phycomyces blakesleeanus]|uniref:Cytochrome P450 CYP5313 n=2 Tax=Phycomyces blakesleeanus TaxID=4837 RepID=A0A167NFA8_PHYB8|nr:cytochrome P450 CYP5313 [Phycomyces blakesleeanus NRRL 1555(-)]OAD75768.1 cytochrome P450 CYP5313 [Phycomyces blakesleeanus NRRL 1555(-)]|eukprot:XP_018293808.1 cytochrome P450 CYP5313 [Phycomyces blakesleeanus NRRL 1555(-)]